MNKIVFVLASLFLLSSCKKDKYEQVPLPIGGIVSANEEYPGGINNTVFDFSVNAFGHVSPSITGLEELNFFVGNSFFNQKANLGR